MVAERPGLTWTAWALGGADAGRLLNGRVSYEKAAARGPHGENSESRAVTHHGRPRLHTQVLPLRASSEHRKTHSETGAKGAWKELIATGPMGPTAQASPRLSQASPSNETKRSTSASSRPQSPRYEGEPHHDGIAVWRETQSLREDLGLSEERNPSVRSVLRSLKGPPSSLASPRRQIPGSASIYSERPACHYFVLNLSYSIHVCLSPNPSLQRAEMSIGSLAALVHYCMQFQDRSLRFACYASDASMDEHLWSQQ